VHPSLEAVVRKALSKDPSARYANARELLDALLEVPESSVRLEPIATSRVHKRLGSTSEVISEGDRRAATTGVERDVTESNEGITVPKDSARALPPVDTMVDRVPIGTLPPSAAPRGDEGAPAAERDRGLALWWAAGVILSVASGVAAFAAVRMWVV
jgi:hypothetical protein